MARTFELPRLRLSAASVLILAGLSLSACGDADGGRDPGSMCAGAKCDEVDGAEGGEEAEEHPEYRKAISACETAAGRLRERTHDQRWDSLASIERDRSSCLTRANDDILPAINDIVRVRRDELGGKLAGEIGRQRSAQELVCTTLVEASEHAESKSGAVATEACGAQSELNVAALISAYADLGVSQLELAESRVRYPECWEAYDDEFGEASLASQKQDATEGLTQCVVDANEDARDELVAKIQDRYPGRASETLEEDTQRALRSHANAVQDVCEVLTLAGPTVDAAEVALNWEHCKIQGASMVGHLGDKLVPGVWPEGDESSEDADAEDADPEGEEPGDEPGEEPGEE